MNVDIRMRAYGLGTVAFGLLKLLLGVFLLLGQYEFQEPGTVYGFLWPRDMHDWMADFRTLMLLITAVWLVYTGLRGKKRRSQQQ